MDASQARPPAPPTAASDAGEFEGWLDHVSLTLTVSRPRRELETALSAQRPDVPFSDEVRTYVHELTHTSQALGSSLGYYTWMLRAVQADFVLRMLRWLVHEARRPLRTPLLRYLPSLQEYDDQARELLDAWHLAEALISEIAGTLEGYLHAATRASLGETTWPQRWKRLQCNILELYGTPETRAPAALYERLWNEPETVDERQVDMISSLTVASSLGLFSVPAAMESAALAMELSPEDDAGLQAILTRVDDRTMEEFQQRHLLVRTRELYPHVRARSLLATHLAACDVALNPPCLPVHVWDRHAVDYGELHPVARIIAIWNVLGQEVAPAEDIDDALRCADDICAALGWTRVSRVLERVSDTYNERADDARGRAFVWAVKGRQHYPPLLQNPRMMLWGSGPLAEMYTQELTPAFWVFDDDWAPGGSANERPQRLIFDTLRTQWMRSIMLGRPDTLRVPVPLPREVLDWYSRGLAHAMVEAIGKEVRPPRVEGPL